MLPKTDNTQSLKVIVIILSVILAVLLWQFIDKQTKLLALRESSYRVQEYLKAEKDSLVKEMIFIRNRYDSLRTDNDSMNVKLDIQQMKIDKLLRMRADNLYLITKYKKEVSTLREVLKSYVVQVDSLMRIKMELRAENREVKSKLSRAEEVNKQLTEDKKELQSKVKKAEILSAKNITAVGLNKNSKEKDEVKRIVKIKVCLTLRENAVAEAGNRDVFIRIIRPDEIILTSSPENIVVIEGEQLTYSASRQINYQNADIDMCIYYDCQPGELIPGTYTVKLYSGGSYIGETTMLLKK